MNPVSTCCRERQEQAGSRTHMSLTTSTPMCTSSHLRRQVAPLGESVVEKGHRFHTGKDDILRNLGTQPVRAHDQHVRRSHAPLYMGGNEEHAGGRVGSQTHTDKFFLLLRPTCTGSCQAMPGEVKHRNRKREIKGRKARCTTYVEYACSTSAQDTRAIAIAIKAGEARPNHSGTSYHISQLGGIVWTPQTQVQIKAVPLKRTRNEDKVRSKETVVFQRGYSPAHEHPRTIMYTVVIGTPNVEKKLVLTVLTAANTVDLYDNVLDTSARTLERYSFAHTHTGQQQMMDSDRGIVAC